MKTIYKYQFKTTDQFKIIMPADSKILAVQIQFEAPCIWALVETENPFVERHFFIFGTGHKVFSPMEYVATYQEMGGALVWHLFEAL